MWGEINFALQMAVNHKFFQSIGFIFGQIILKELFVIYLVKKRVAES